MKLFSYYFSRWFVVGFAFGLLASVIYLLIEAPPFLYYPEWVHIAGFPGTKLGCWSCDHLYNLHNFPAEAFGCMINGIPYGVIFLAIGVPVRKFRKSR